MSTNSQLQLRGDSNTLGTLTHRRIPLKYATDMLLVSHTILLNGTLQCQDTHRDNERNRGSHFFTATTTKVVKSVAFGGSRTSKSTTSKANVPSASNLCKFTRRQCFVAPGYCIFARNASRSFGGSGNSSSSCAMACV
eukprot:gnl/MRDRNA2_/MRDRNA2_208348_c0_seq1.p1 gnl/MRDRNA2_/MRDRNA2_208348_c0~~gnl/MRDRNA2_/MRDRNA2_208348_c0_seq1.p1  ORF type:complete len:138 (-),score=12.88 gnl/MRDRNA2_/MRDRNA2_208348_c0_seq1:36-449(-)